MLSQREELEPALQSMSSTASSGVRVMGGSRRLPAPHLLVWALTAPTLHRLRLGEGALFAVNFSIIWYHSFGLVRGLLFALVSAVTLDLMYVFNDLFDAPSDRWNPKKDPALVSLYVNYRTAFYLLLLALKGLTVAFAWIALGADTAVAVTAVMLVNIIYSTILKGVPVLDLLWAGLWGGAYAAIPGISLSLGILVSLMTAICHLYQALGDRTADAESRITTTAVFSQRLSGIMFFLLSAMVFVMLRGPFGTLVALSAFTPLALWLSFRSTQVGWMLTKLYFGVVWLALLEYTRAVG
jgi:4-hydroxybenzoate polyprenyltransferase